MSYRIDDGLKELLESGVGVLVATGDAHGRPHIAYGWGPRIADDRATVDVFLDTARSAQALADLRSTGQIAMTVAHPVSYRSAQIKGDYRDDGDADDDDRAWVARHRDEFLTATSLVGDPPDAIRNLWMEDVVRVSFTVQRAFDQTPGPEAGKPL